MSIIEILCFYTRAHRYDVYERQIGSYIPYRKEALAYLKGVFCVAKEGKIFLQKCYPNYAEKIFLSHLGVSTKEQYNKKVKKVADISFYFMLKFDCCQTGGFHF